MEAHDRELGPIDIVVIAYPAGAPMTGEAAPLLVDLVERGIIRVLDVMFVIKNEDGTFSGFDATDLDDKGVGDFASSRARPRPARRRGRREGRGGDRAGQRGGDDRLREPLGGASSAAVRRNGGVLSPSSASRRRT